MKMDGLKKIIRVMQSYNEEPSVLQEVIALHSLLTSRE